MKESFMITPRENYSFQIDSINSMFQSISVSKNHIQIEGNGFAVILKICFKCNKLMSLECFYECHKWLPCKKCHLKAVKEWKKNNPKAVSEQKYEYRYKQKLKSVGLL